MLVGDTLERYSGISYESPNPSWLAGALEGLSVVGERQPSWRWDWFLEEIYEMVEFFGGVTPSEPGSIPVEGDGSLGSAYDTLGGYVSVAGQATSQGILIRLATDRLKDLKQLLQDMVIIKEPEGVLVPHHELDHFLMLIPLKGPIMEILQEEVFA
jgi:hypothetical protein